MTRYLDADGDPCRQADAVWSVQDPEWTDDDRIEAFVLDAYEADLCRGCGKPRSRSKHPEMMGHYEVKYRGECQSCAAEEEHAKSHKGDPVSMQYATIETDDAPTQAELDEMPIDWTALDMPEPRKPDATPSATLGH